MQVNKSTFRNDWNSGSQIITEVFPHQNHILSGTQSKVSFVAPETSWPLLFR